MYDLTIDAARVARAEQQFIREQLDELERDGVILGVSGGLDSAVVASLAARAVGPNRVLALLLPERDSSRESRTDARLVLDRLGIPSETMDITPVLSALGVYRSVPLQFLGTRAIKEHVVRSTHETYRQRLGESPFLVGLLGTRGRPGQQVLDAGHAYARAKHRVRLVTLYHRAEQENRLVLGTTNRAEALSGLVVKWGDNVADAEPLLPLFKTQVRQLARFLDVPRRIIEKAPTPDLMPGIDDETAFGVRYEVLDQVLHGLERGDPLEAIAAHAGTDLQTARTVAEMRRRSRHMRELPPVPALPGIAYGT
jgi:NAD+ synthase